MTTSYNPNLLDPPLIVGGAPLFFTGEDALITSILNSQPNVQVTIRGRFLQVPTADDPRPTPRPFSDTFTPASDRTNSTRITGLGEGWMLDCAVNASAGSPIVGQTFCGLSISRGLGASQLTFSRVAAGYITQKQRVGWPSSGMIMSIDGPGAVRSIAGTTPAAGAEISEVVPTGARWELLAFFGILTTSAVVANRRPHLTIDDGTTVFAKMASSTSETASFAWNNSWFSGATRFAELGAQAVEGNLPIGLLLLAGHRIKTLTVALDAGDQWSGVQYLVKEWIEGS